MQAKLVLIVVNVLLISMVGCNLPSSQNNSQSDLAATITAQAMTIQAPAELPNVAPSSTPAALKVSVSSDTNCRTGNSVNFDLVFTMKPGDSAPVIGKDTADDYWVIDAPSGGTCWLWGQYATVNGDTSNLPEISPPSDSQAPNSQVSNSKPTKMPKPTSTPGSSQSAKSKVSSNNPIVCPVIIPCFPPTVVIRP